MEDPKYSRVTVIIENEDSIEAIIVEKATEFKTTQEPKYHDRYPTLYGPVTESKTPHHVTIEFDAHPVEPRNTILWMYNTTHLFESDEEIKKAYDAYIAFTEYQGDPMGRILLMQPLIDTQDVLSDSKRNLFRVLLKLYEQNKSFK